MLANAIPSAAILILLSAILIIPSLRKQPGFGVFPALLIISIVLWQRGDGLAVLGLLPPISWPATIGRSMIIGISLALGSVLIIEPLAERWTESAHDLSALGDITGDWRATLAWITAAWLMAATLEEIIFRGYMMREIAHLLGDRPGANVLNILTTSIVFGLAHWYQGRAGALSTGILSIFLGMFYIYSDFNLWPLMITHGMIDTVGLALIFVGWDQRLKRLLFDTSIVPHDEHPSR